MNLNAHQILMPQYAEWSPSPYVRYDIWLCHSFKGKCHEFTAFV